MQLYPISFAPIFKERIWGGRRLASLYGKALPIGKSIGESWEICDRPEGTSVVANGPASGRDLRWLMHHHGREIAGPGFGGDARFPLLVKLLDAEEDLSLQVHPPSHAAKALRGESKTEFWYVADAKPHACLHAGLKRGVTASEFERQAREGTVAESFHRHSLTTGDAMFLPSGRVHALGAGTVVIEIQENSDTTYRVFDWNRVGLDGKPRDLHLEQAMAAIHFEDYEPDLVRSPWIEGDNGQFHRDLVDDPLFRIRQFRLQPGPKPVHVAGGKMTIWAVISGALRLSGGGEVLELAAGQFGLVPASLDASPIQAIGPTQVLQVEYPGLGST
jgi:mannose-6-phosphate isomerase